MVLAFVYYECPMLCTQVLNGSTTSLTVLDETVGREFDVVAVSFDPRETPALATGKKKAYLDRYKRPGRRGGWHFLTGDEASIKALTDAAGLQLRVGREDAAVRAPQRHHRGDARGRLSRYFFGIEYAPRDVKFALIESSAGKIGTRSISCCSTAITTIRRRGRTGSWRWARCGSAARVTLLALVGFVFVSIRREQRADGRTASS